MACNKYDENPIICCTYDPIICYTCNIYKTIMIISDFYVNFVKFYFDIMFT